MIIAVAGLTAAGKNTLGEAIAKSLNLRLVCPTFKDLAKKEGISLMEFQKKAESDPNIDLKFDAYLKEEANKGDCVVTTWLGPWIVDADIRILVFAPFEIRAERLAKRDGITIEEAKKHIKERDEENRQRYLKLYGIDIYNQDIFDVCINNDKLTPKQTRDIALAIIKAIAKVKKLKLKVKK
jgi:cytidylate kinase